MIDLRRVVGCAVLLISVEACSAKELVCLKSGFCLQADSHRSSNGTLVLRLGQGTLEYPEENVASIQSVPEAVTEKPSVQPSAALAAIKTDELLSQAADQQGLYRDFVLSVAKVESGLHPQAVSRKGALGLMQLMPETAETLGVDPLNASQNAVGGAKYLRSLLIRYHGDSVLALAAYNAGPGAVERFHGVPPFQETRSYVIRVLHEYERQQKLHARQQTRAEAVSSRPTSTD
ncbi:MAG: lytic transglycosylase domain-containing protein [Acidobacteriaceae bacterium]|nr:lytic transglycosylase domain-containing protein [Acidobacteriaceae bacterium]